MRKHAIIAIKLTLILTFILGVIYPLLITGISQLVFPKQANGSLIKKQGNIVGSKLIMQSFNKPEYFHPRRSAAFNPSDSGNNESLVEPYISGGSNLAPTSKLLAARVKKDVTLLIDANPKLQTGKIPVDMATTSASGLDPDISPANALAQVPRVAKARRMSETRLAKFVKSHILSRQFGVLGEDRINVLLLNMELDAINVK